MNKTDLNLAMAGAFEEICNEAAQAFNYAYDGHTSKDMFIEQMKCIQQMCGYRIDRIEAIEVTVATKHK